MANAPDTLREAIKHGLQKAGWQSPTDDTLRQVEFAVNTWLGDQGNDAEKDARREVAMQKIGKIMERMPEYIWPLELRAILKECQG